jgi:aspartyl protease family protein
LLRLAVIAALACLSVAGVAKALLDGGALFSAPPPLRGSQTSDPASDSWVNTASVSKAADGHFWAEGLVDGSKVRFLVDTGCSSVALTPADAQRLGIDPAHLIYDTTVRTANGEALAARIKLASVSVAGARMSNVEAVVVGRGLATSLLGMTYLGRLSRFVATRDSLILQP